MVKIEIDYQQIKKAIQRLSPPERAKLIDDLQRDTLSERFRQLFARVDARVKLSPISNKEILRLCKETRKELHARQHQSRR